VDRCHPESPGKAELQVFGDTRFRIQAEKAGNGWRRQSGVVEMESLTLPRSVDLVLSAAWNVHQY